MSHRRRARTLRWGLVWQWGQLACQAPSSKHRYLNPRGDPWDVEGVSTSTPGDSEPRLEAGLSGAPKRNPRRSEVGDAPRGEGAPEVWTGVLSAETGDEGCTERSARRSRRRRLLADGMLLSVRALSGLWMSELRREII